MAIATKKTFATNSEMVREGGVDSILEVYVITGVGDDGLVSASYATDLPAFGDVHPARTDLIAQRITIRPLPDTKGTEFAAEVLYRPVSATLLPVPEWYYRYDWSVGTIQQRVSVDVAGRYIGDPVLRSPSGLFILRAAERVERELDVQVPCIELQLSYPITNSWNLPLVSALTGFCNESAVLIDGHWFAAGMVLYLGAQCVMTWDGYTLRRDQRHHFAIGWQQLPTQGTIPVVWGRLNVADAAVAYNGPTPLPLCFGTYPTFSPCKEDGSYDPNGAGTKLSAINVVQVYKVANIGMLIPAVTSGGLQTG